VELELQIDAPNPPEHGLAQPPDGLGPSEVNFVALANRHPSVAAVALANKTVRIAWAMIRNGTNYQAPAMPA